MLTGGGDKPYAIGLLSALVARGVEVDFVGSDEFSDAAIVRDPGVTFLNLRGGQNPNASLGRKLARVFVYYIRLFHYAATSDCRIFHILWANRFLLLDRVALILFLRLLRKKLVFTAHNVNERQRDGGDNLLNQSTLRYLYHSVDHIFVHTRLSKQLLQQFAGTHEMKITVIPFGINDTIPKSGMTRTEARSRLGIDVGEKVLLFFGNIASYKGIEYAVAALGKLHQTDASYRLIVAGQVKAARAYWNDVQKLIDELGLERSVIQHIRYIADEDVEPYFVAADVLLLPYKFIYQSGVLFLAYSFGLPVIASDVGSLSEDIVSGNTGYVCRPQDPNDLADAIRAFYESELFRNLENNRSAIVEFARKHYSWSTVGERTRGVYARLLDGRE